ncbi:unnamed protein product [Darwinula stevensoni]|uniref:Sulfotransferase n=1 Tax=Darwinula stevensoni TaxID=69355 RepID=A0A7R8XEL8_9CRUS|nr:unnamed protein product [Darwinula stevensoni]CAG0895874.1 unnamed protein product [Darwinula stevensoni]
MNMDPEASETIKPDGTPSPNLYESDGEELLLYHKSESELVPLIEGSNWAEVLAEKFREHSKRTSNFYLNSIVVLLQFFVLVFIYVAPQPGTMRPSPSRSDTQYSSNYNFPKVIYVEAFTFRMGFEPHNVRQTEGNRMYSNLTAETENWLNRLPPVPPMNRTVKVFIYGLGRSGTSIVSRILSSHPSAIYFHEPFLPKIKLSGVQFVYPKLDIYEQLYNCNFSGIIPDLPMYHWKNSVPFSIWPYVEFLFGMKLAPTVTPVVFSRLVRNEAFMKRHCSRYPIRVIKEPDRMPVH